jgi:acetyl-CoA acetyltransferase
MNSEDIFIVGVGMSRFGKLADESVKSLTGLVVKAALADAGASVSDIGLACFSNTTQSIIDGQHLIAGQVALRPLGLGGIPIVNVENACASAATAVNQAIAYLRSGACDVALAVGVDKMTSPDKARSAEVFNGGWDVLDPDYGRDVASLPSVVPPAAAGGMSSPFMDLYATMTRAHMKRFGTTQGQLAAIAAKNHFHSTMNPLSQYQRDMTVEQVLAGPVVAWPLTLPMCAPVSDGAAAALLCTRAALSRFPDARPIRVLASVLTSGQDRPWADFERGACRLAAQRAYEIAGVAPEDVDVCEVHDASAFGELVQTENLGLCEAGQGGWMAERGETRLGGRIPVNPSGGLESKGHPIGATGLGQIFELVTQLRGDAGARQVEGARIAVAENGGGFLGVEEAAAAVTILAS